MVVALFTSHTGVKPHSCTGVRLYETASYCSFFINENP